MRTQELPSDDVAGPFTYPEIEHELGHDPRGYEVGLRGLLEQPQRPLCERLSRLTPAALYRIYDWNSAADDEVSSAA